MLRVSRWGSWWEPSSGAGDSEHLGQAECREQRAGRHLKPLLEMVKGSGFAKLHTESQWVKRKQPVQIHFREHFVDADV